MSIDFMQSPEWITAFDWYRAREQDRAMASLSWRLMAALQMRETRRHDLAQSEDAQSFGRYIAALRCARGWSRPQLAEQAGIDPLAIALLEEAALTTDELSPGLVARLVSAFGLAVADLAINPVASRAIVDGPHSFGHWLRERLSSLTQPTGVALQFTSGWRGSLPAPRDAQPGQGMLTQPVLLPAQEISHSNGQMLHVLPTLEPTDPPEAALAILVVRVLDTHDQPVSGVSVELEMDALPFIGATVTDAQGWTRILDLPVERLTTLDHLDLRLS